MKPLFQQIRESAARVAQAWGEANHFEVDLASADLAMGARSWSGRVQYLAVAYGGHQSLCSVAFEQEGQDMVVFAQGAAVERFSLQPWHLEWSARVGHAARESQALAVCKAIWRNR
jgi:hypothetical protein